MESIRVLQMKNISKEFAGNAVLRGVNLDVLKGEIHALVGENGAGKSTLLNILFGMAVIHETGGFRGEVWLNGRELRVKSPKEAMDAGIGMVHQEFMLLPGFSVAENIKLNREVTRPNWLSRLGGTRLETLNLDEMGKQARHALDRVEISIDEWLPVAGMPVGHRQFVEIAREIDKKGISLMIFDEPTAVLTESEAAHLLKALKTIAGSGIGVLFISHRLDEVLEVADRITVLRDGEVVATMSRHEARLERLAEAMVGRTVDQSVHLGRGGATGEGDAIMRIDDLYVHMPGEEVRGVNLSVRRKEILGVGGLAGQGKIGIANGIMGLRPSKGRLVVEGQEVSLNDPRASLDSGLVFLSEDRRGVGLMLDESIEDNIAVGGILSKDMFVRRLGPLGLEDRRSIREHALEMISSLDIKCIGPEQRAGRLSGGNQQKVCIAKAMTMKPKVLLISEPTRGIDIGTKQKILDDVLLGLNREQGITIVITSSELAELRRICDRIAIMYEGRIGAILNPSASDAEFGLCMAGKGMAGNAT